MGDFPIILCLNFINISQKQAWRPLIYFAWMKSMYFREYVRRFSRKLQYFCILGVSHLKSHLLELVRLSKVWQCCPYSSNDICSVIRWQNTFSVSNFTFYDWYFVTFYSTALIWYGIWHLFDKHFTILSCKNTVCSRLTPFPKCNLVPSIKSPFPRTMVIKYG